MQYLNSTFAQIVNHSMGRDGPLFKGRYKAIVVGADEYLLRLSRYIHLNPRDLLFIVSVNKRFAPLYCPPFVLALLFAIGDSQ